MANRSYLVAHDFSTPLPYPDSVECAIKASNYQLPILWLALFTSHNRKHCKIPCVNDSGLETLESVPTLHATREECCLSFKQHKPRLMAMLSMPFRKYITEWERIISIAKFGYLQIDMTELWYMTSPSDFDLSLDVYQGAFENSNDTNWRDLLNQTSFNYRTPLLSSNEIEDEAVYGLIGYEWQ